MYFPNAYQKKEVLYAKYIIIHAYYIIIIDSFFQKMLYLITNMVPDIFKV
jgi:hypothetical protein